MSHIKDNFRNDVVVTFVGQMLVLAITFVLNKIISNQYSIADFGLYNLIKKTVSVVSYVMLMAMGIAIPKYVAEASAEENKKKVESYMLSGFITITSAFVLVFILLVFLRIPFSKLMFGDRASEAFVVPICLYSYGLVLITYVYSYYRGIDRFIRYNVICMVMQVGLLAIAIFVPHNLVVLYYVWSVFLLFYGIMEIVSLFRKNDFSFRALREKLFTLKTMLEYSVPRVPGEFILFAYNLLPLVIIQHRFGGEDVAYFAAALTINSLIFPLFSITGTILLPYVSKSLVNKERNVMKQNIRKLMILYIVIAIIAVIVVYFFGEWLLTLLYNKNYVQSIKILRITILAIIPNALYLLFRNPLDAISKYPYNTICLLTSFVIYLGLLCVSSSIEFCAMALVIAYTISGCLSLVFWKRELKRCERMS